MYYPKSKRFVWAHGGLGMQRLGHMVAPHNHCDVVFNEYFFDSGPNVYVDHADHLWNNHRKDYEKPTVAHYKELLRYFSHSSHIIIHEHGWGQYARILRILKHMLNTQQYEKYDHIRVSDSALPNFAKQVNEIADNNFKNGSKLSSMSKHYEMMSYQMHRAGLHVLDIGYDELYVRPSEEVVEDIFEHFDIPERQYINAGFIVKQLQSYHQTNVDLIKENFPEISEKLQLWLDKQAKRSIM